jgi:rhamnose transport system permease protein
MSNDRPRLGAILTRWEIILLYFLAAVIVLNGVLSPYFLNVTNILFSTFNFTEKAIMALPMMFIIICADIDISVASIVALSSVFMGMAAARGVATPVLVLIGLGAGLALGVLNGLLITRLEIPAIAVTIGGLTLYRGIAYAILGNRAYTLYPAPFAFFGQGYVFGKVFPFELLVFIVLAVLFWLVLHRTVYGRHLYAIGNNPVAARFSGINVQGIRFANFALMGLLSGLASVLFTSRIGSTRPDIASGWELQVITTVVLGGVSIFGGSGNIFGVLIGIFLLGFVRFGLGLINIPGQVSDIVTGFLLIVAILVPASLQRSRTRRLLRQEQSAGASPAER